MGKNDRLITDKDLTVFLVAKGFKIIDVKKDQQRHRCLIYFLDTVDLQEAILSFANKSETINISEYMAAERRVKTLLNTQKFL